VERRVKHYILTYPHMLSAVEVHVWTNLEEEAMLAHLARELPNKLREVISASPGPTMTRWSDSEMPWWAPAGAQWLIAAEVPTVVQAFGKLK